MPLSESDTRAKLIDTKLKVCGWDESYIIREYCFTDGRLLLKGNRGKRCFVDYLLKYKNENLAIVEAKSEDKHPTDGLQQAIDYAQKLNVRFVYSSNGHKIYMLDLITGKGTFVNEYLKPDDLYSIVIGKGNKLKDDLLAIPFYLTGQFLPRYYQEIAVNKAIEAIANDKKRILLTLATGTGKTFIAFQIVHKLFTARWNLDKAERRPRVLFLADRNILADQAINTFNPYEKELIKINGEEIKRRDGIVPTNANIFFAIYQAISEKENIGGYYKQYPKDFFDLVIIDECHRGSANEEGSWRAIIDHFSPAVHLGLTATPKRTDNVDTYKYFGDPVYEYSLIEGINDGFLSPYKVKRIQTNIDEYVYTTDDTVVAGELDKDLYQINDFEREIIIPKRTELVAQAILDNINPMDKTIVFCVNQAHALDMRDAINKFKAIADVQYCVRVTSDEGELGSQLLERFQDNDKDTPVILTTSQMLTTGVDARNVRNIVLVRNIKSMVEFKQIIGRGTRLFEGKDFFTIIDFTGATNLFYDPEWDGLPENDIKEPTGGGNKSGDKPVDSGSATPPEPPKEKVVIELSGGRIVKVIYIETRYIDEKGKPLSAKQLLERLLGNLPELFNSEEELRTIWEKPETREELLKKLGDFGFDDEQLESLVEMLNAKESDIFDVLAYLCYDKQIITREQRVEEAKKDTQFFDSFKNDRAKAFLNFILERYKAIGIDELKRKHLPELVKLGNLGTTRDAQEVFGTMQNLIDAYYILQKNLYKQL